MVRIVKCIQLRVLTVNCQRILGQVVRSDAEKVHFFRQIPAYHDCRRGFNHNALLRVAKLEILCSQLRLDLLDNLRDRLDLPDTCDHRIHNLEIAIGTCPKQRAKLCLENLRSCQADTDRPAAHRRIFLFFQLKIIALLVRADVQRADNDRFARHRFRYLFIYLELLLLRRKCFFFQIQKFAAEQSDARRIVLNDRRQILAVANVRIQADLLAIQSDCFAPFQCLQQFFLLLFLLLPAAHCFQCLLIRFHIQDSVSTIHNRKFPIYRLIERHVRSDQRRNAHRTRQDRRVGIDGTVYRHKG